MAARTDAILDLTTFVDRPKIAIDGARYEILSPEELSVADLERFSQAGRRLEALGAKRQPSPQEEAELLGLIRDLAARIMVGVPEDVRDKLSVSHLFKVIEVFTGLLPGRLAPAGATTRSTGARPPRGSSDSTAATPAGGSRKRPSRSSGRT